MGRREGEAGGEEEKDRGGGRGEMRGGEEREGEVGGEEEKGGGRGEGGREEGMEEGKGDNVDTTSLLRTSVMHLGETHF